MFLFRIVEVLFFEGVLCIRLGILDDEKTDQHLSKGKARDQAHLG